MINKYLLSNVLGYQFFISMKLQENPLEILKETSIGLHI